MKPPVSFGHLGGLLDVFCYWVSLLPPSILPPAVSNLDEAYLPENNLNSGGNLVGVVWGGSRGTHDFLGSRSLVEESKCLV